MSTLNDYRRNHLFLLVGTNPLPNYVAARLLVTTRSTNPNDVCRIYLLHTQQKTSTDMAKNLHRVINRDRPGLAEMYEIDDNNGAAIEEKVKTILSDCKVTDSIGLNYTGGTKPMSTHAYHAIAEKFPNAVCSYLDALKLQMLIDERPGVPFFATSVRTAIQISFRDLFDLHGYKCDALTKSPWSPPELRQALAQIIQHEENGFKEWHTYLSNPKFDKLPTRDQYKLLTPFFDACQNLANGERMELIPVFIAQKIKKPALKVDPHKWLVSTWLEEHVLDAVSQLADDLGITEFGISLYPTKSNAQPFELDVAAIRGYQLFAISCIATQDKAQAKEHLFEILARAVQLGGDEARFALVTCMNSTHTLEQEIGQIANIEDRVCVLGRDDLEMSKLKLKLRDWFLQGELPKEQPR